MIDVQMLVNEIAYELCKTKRKPLAFIRTIDKFFDLFKPSYVKTFKLVLTGKTMGRGSTLRRKRTIIKRSGREVIPAQHFNQQISFATGIARTNKGLFSIKLWIQYLT